MKESAANLEFEEAAKIRDEINMRQLICVYGYNGQKSDLNNFDPFIIYPLLKSGQEPVLE